MPMLTPEDSERVADAMIDKISEIDINGAVYEAIRSVVMPNGDRRWKTDWFPLTIEEMCDSIRDGVCSSVYDATKKINVEI